MGSIVSIVKSETPDYGRPWCANYQRRMADFMRGTTNLDFACYGLGLIGEFSEIGPPLFRVTPHRIGEAPIDALNDLLSEIGDSLWYAAAICNMADISLRDCYVRSSEWVDLASRFTTIDVFGFGSRAAGNICELVKKHVAHGKGLRSMEIEMALGKFLSTLRHFAVLGDSSLREVSDLNISKLTARWPDGFQEGEGKEAA